MAWPFHLDDEASTKSDGISTQRPDEARRLLPRSTTDAEACGGGPRARTTRRRVSRGALAAASLCGGLGLVGTGIARNARTASTKPANALLAARVPDHPDYERDSRGPNNTAADELVPGRYVFGSRDQGLFWYDTFAPELGAFPLTCALFDDDAYYPLVPFGDAADPSANCEAQDANPARCDACLADPACAALCGSTTPLCEGGDASAAFEYIEPCKWQAIADTPATCARRFEPTPPLASRNLPPRVDLPTITHDTPGTDVNLDWSCNFHSMCQACTDPEEPSGINKYCLAAILHYDRTATGYTTIDLFADLDFWCSEANLAKIQGGDLSPSRRSSDDDDDSA